MGKNKLQFFEESLSEAVIKIHREAMLRQKKVIVDKACKCYCDDICDKSRCGMCFHKYDGEYQVKNTFQYNECNELKFLRKAMEE